MFVTLPDQRHTVIEQASGLVFRIPSRCHVFGVVLLTLGLCVWLIIEIAAPIFLLQALFHPAEFFIFVFVCVAVWTVGGLFALRLWLWQLKGCEIITLSPTALVIQRAIFGFGRRRHYDVAGIRHLRVSPYGALVFDCGDKTIRFGAGVGTTEARLILHTIISRVPGLAGEAVEG
jgi:hypothetical protein